MTTFGRRWYGLAAEEPEAGAVPPTTDTGETPTDDDPGARFLNTEADGTGPDPGPEPAEAEEPEPAEAEEPDPAEAEEPDPGPDPGPEPEPEPEPDPGPEPDPDPGPEPEPAEERPAAEEPTAQ